MDRGRNGPGTFMMFPAEILRRRFLYRLPSVDWICIRHDLG